MGLTYKEDVADTRETPAKEIIKELQKYGMELFGYDPVLKDIEDEFGIQVVSNLKEIKVDGVILAVAHEAFKEVTVGKLKGIMNDNPVLIDVRGFFDSQEAAEKGFYYRTL
ncbi:UDP-glucose 6-dehydrogenase [subsurface metagenome]